MHLFNLSVWHTYHLKNTKEHGQKRSKCLVHGGPHRQVTVKMFSHNILLSDAIYIYIYSKQENDRYLSPLMRLNLAKFYIPNYLHIESFI